MIGLIMGPAASLLDALAGKYLRTITVPLLVFGLLVLSHQLLKARDARLVARGEQICDARWIAKQREEAAKQAEADLWAGRRILDIERLANEGLSNDLQTLKESVAILHATPAAVDSNCLSPRVLDLLQGGQIRAGSVPK